MIRNARLNLEDYTKQKSAKLDEGIATPIPVKANPNMTVSVDQKVVVKTLRFFFAAFRGDLILDPGSQQF